VLAWLSVWSEVQMLCMWSSWCHCHPIISCLIKLQSGSTFLVPAYPGFSGKKAVKWVFKVKGGSSVRFIEETIQTFLQHTNDADTDLPQSQWSLRNRFSTAQGHHGATRKLWNQPDDDMWRGPNSSQIVNNCLQTKLDGGSCLLCSVDPQAAGSILHMMCTRAGWWVVNGSFFQMALV